MKTPGRPSNGRGTGRLDFLATLVLALVSAILMNLPERSQHGIGHAIRSSALRPFLAMNGAVAAAKARARDFEVLRAQTDSLLVRTASQRTLAEENRQLRSLLGLSGQPREHLVAATVIRPGTSQGSIFYLDVGRTDGIRRFDAVVTEAGLLGQVQDVRAHRAAAFDWSHPDFRVSAMTLDGQVHGLVESVRGAHREQDLLVIRGTAYLSGLQRGTELVTSGRGGTFPRGIRIGWVTGEAETSAGWTRSYYVEPVVYPGSATYALVDIAEETPPLAPVVADSIADSADADGSDTDSADANDSDADGSR